jgi:hypothetical protein
MARKTQTYSELQEAAPPFEQHAKAALLRVRAALAELLSSVGADPTRSQAVARQFGLNKNLTWRISKIVGEEDPCAAIPHIPGTSGLNIFIRSLERAGAPDQAIASVRDAIAEFDRMVDIHSGDRETLEMMLGNLTSDGEQQRNESQRKLAFRGNRATWGVQARVQLCVNVIAPATDPDWVDLAWLSGLADFRRLRRDAVWAMASARKFMDDGSQMALGQIHAIDPAYSVDDGAPLLSGYCSQPLPDIRTRTEPDGMIRYELLEGPVGNTAAATCILGIYGRSFVRRTRAENDTLGEHAARLYTPVEVLVHDLFVHRDLSHALSPDIFLYSQMPGGPVYPASGRDRGLLPLYQRAQPLGHPPDLVTPELPTYPRMIHTVFDRLGWDPGDFFAFRLRLRYPPIPSLAVFRYPLADPS